MSTTTSRIDYSAIESGFPGRPQASGAASHPHAAPDDPYALSPYVRKVTLLTLFGVGVLLAVVAAYVWVGSLQWLQLH